MTKKDRQDKPGAAAPDAGRLGNSHTRGPNGWLNARLHSQLGNPGYLTEYLTGDETLSAHDGLGYSVPGRYNPPIADPNGGGAADVMDNAVGLEGFGDRWPRGGPRERPRPEDKDLLSHGGAGAYDEEQFMPVPERMPPHAHRGGQRQMIIDYLMDRGSQNGANGWLNDRLMRRMDQPITDTQMQQQHGGDGYGPLDREALMHALRGR